MINIPLWGYLTAGVVAVGLAGYAYIHYANGRIDDLERDKAILTNQVAGLEQLSKAQTEVYQSQERVTTHERTVVERVEATQPSNACAASPAIGVVLDDFRMYDFEGNPRTRSE